mmetsp:Transcript_70763/g.166020  ORF Transcript_70763/g.166020 Transcript_70763/m.166020 type:complete len:320 (+) Transcript_70763:60-1019(+)
MATSPTRAIRLVNAATFFGFLSIIQAASWTSILAMLLGFRLGHGWVAAKLIGLLSTRFATFAGSCQVLDTGNPIVYLSNHRSWGDFWVDAALLGGPSFIARTLVAAAIPCSALWGHFEGWLWFFARGTHHEEGAVAWMVNFLTERIRSFASKGVVLYPEGTRSLLPEGLPLKLGSLAAAYNLGWPVQVVITKNKELVTAERSLAVTFGTLCSTAVSAPVYPQGSATLEAFLATVKETWAKTWHEAYHGAVTVRDGALLPGAKLSTPHFSLRGGWPLQLLRLLIAGLVLVMVRRRAQRRRTSAEDEPARANGAVTANGSQ